MKRAFARHLRSNLTEPERRLWQVLRRQQLDGWRFRRQVPLGRYVVDFCCLPLQLIVEADGGQHDESRSDVERDAWLTAEGFTVLRFWNSEILGNPEGVAQFIRDTATRLEAALN